MNMNEFLYLRPFLASFSCAIFLLFFLRWVSRRHKKSGAPLFLRLRRFGGAAIILSFLFATLSNDRLVVTPVILGMIIGSVAILFFGLSDDIAKLDWKVQLTFQILLGILLFIFGMRIFSLPMPFVGQVFLNTIPAGVMIGCFILIVWIVLVMNVLNWADGIDGLLPSISLVSFFVIFFLSQRPEVNQPPVGILSMALFGSLLGLFLFNMPPARLLAGTSGSFFSGFALASLSVLSGTKMATALLVLSLPLIDALWVFVERLWSGASPFCGGDFRHLHYRLREIGWSDRRIVVWYTLFTGFVGVLALSMNALGKTISFLLVGVFTLILLSWVRRKSFSFRSRSNF